MSYTGAKGIKKVLLTVIYLINKDGAWKVRLLSASGELNHGIVFFFDKEVHLKDMGF